MSSEKRDKRIYTRVTSGEKVYLEKLTDRYNITMTELIRTALQLDDTAQLIEQIEDTKLSEQRYRKIYESLAEISADNKRVGRNINQITRRINTENKVLKKQLDKYEYYLKAIDYNNRKIVRMCDELWQYLK